MTPDMLIVFGFLIFVTLLFIFGIVRVDMVGLLMMILLPLSGVISPADALSGLSSNAVVSIIAVIIIGEGLDKTGAMNHLARHIIKLAGRSETRIMAFIAGTVAILSSFMQNIGAAALFLPATSRICGQLNIPVSRILMPMGFCAVIGGCLSLVGSSPLILLNDLMAAWWANNPGAMAGQGPDPFGLFSVTPIGIALIATALLYFIFFGKLVLPKAQAKDPDLCILNQDLECTYGTEIHNAYELKVPKGFQTRRLDELALRPRFHSTVICICKRGASGGWRRVSVPARHDIVEPGDIVGMISNKEHINDLTQSMGWELLPELDHMAEVLSPDQAGVAEAIVSPRSELVGKTLRQLYFRNRFQVNPLAHFRRDTVAFENISQIKLHAGDALLLFGEWDKFNTLQQKKCMAFTQQIREVTMHPEKSIFALGCLALALFLALGLKVQLSIALLTGAVGMMLTRVLTIDEAYQGVDWMTVFLLAGLIPLGLAFEKTGAALYLSSIITGHMAGVLTPFFLFLLIGCLTSFFTLVISNVGAAVLMVPLAMNMALQCHADPRMAALLVAVAASNTFALPTHQVNALIMRPGGYKILDFIRAGTGLTLLYILVVMSMMTLFYGISA
jgi:di/tricarboxylate transporter